MLCGSFLVAHSKEKCTNCYAEAGMTGWMHNTKLTNGIITDYQFLTETYKDKYLAGEKWTYLGPTGIILTPGYWLVCYNIRVGATSTAMDCSIRSTINNVRCQSFKTNSKNLIISAELTEIVHRTEILSNLYPQIYVPEDCTFSDITVGVTCIRLK